MPLYDFSNQLLYNPTYLPLMQNKSEFLHLFGSAGSGKSRFEAQKEIVKSFLPHRKHRRTLVARKVFSTLSESCYAELKAVIYEWRLEDIFHITKNPLYIENMITGVGFVFRGFDDPEKIKSITGVDRAWYEETTESKGRSEILLLRGRMRGFKEIQLTMTYNPIDEHHWLNKEWHDTQPKGHYFHHSTYKDNIRMLAVDDSFAKFIESTEFTDPNYYRVYGLGLWGQVTEGLIYPHTRVCEFPQVNGEDDIDWYGLDYGYTNPTALVAQKVEDALPKKRLHNKEIIYKPGLDGPGLVKEMHRQGVRKDLWIVCDSASPSIIRTLRDAGYKVQPSLKFAGSVLAGINDVRSFELCIAAGSKELIKESRNYHKNQVKGEWVEEPEPGQVDHGMDGIRYGVQRAVMPVRNKKKKYSSSQSAFG